MGPPCLCTCITRKCGEHTDPATGVKGTLVTSRAYRDHQTTDRAAEAHRLATEAQKRALDAQENYIAAFLERTPPPETAEKITLDQDRYRIDGVRRLVSHISGVQDVARDLRRAADVVGRAPTAPTPDSKVEEALLGFKQLRGSIAAQFRSLALTSRGPYRKDSAVKFLRNQATTELEQLSNAVDDLESSWDAVAKRRDEEREANRARGVPDYNSGRSRLYLGVIRLN